MRMQSCIIQALASLDLQELGDKLKSFIQRSEAYNCIIDRVREPDLLDHIETLIF